MKTIEPRDDYAEMITMYLGLSLEGWKELLKFKAENRLILTNELLEEIARLRGKIGFYESRINQMAYFAKQGQL